MKIDVTFSIDAPIEDIEQLEWLRDCLAEDIAHKEIHITSTGKVRSCLDNIIDGDVYKTI